ncbi:hypothetical protein ABFX02_12G131400 [Erythranthe guttata]
MASSNVEYPWPATVNGPSFISMKLCFHETDGTNYKAWKEQMLCLIEGQDLLGFIDGTIPPPPSAPETSTSTSTTTARGGNDYRLWRRSDRLLKGWILGSLHEDMVSEVSALETSRNVWLHLENTFYDRQKNATLPQLELPNMPSMYSPLQQVLLQNNILKSLEYSSTGENKLHETKEEDLIMKYMPLHKAALEGDWETAKRIFDRDPRAKSAVLDNTGLTPLHVAVGTGKKGIHFVRNMVELLMADDTGEELMARKNVTGHTALHAAANVGNTEAATILVNRMLRLLYTPNFLRNDFPVHTAALFSHKRILLYLLQATKEQKPYDCYDGLRLLVYLIQADFFDVALHLVDMYPYLATLVSPDGGCALWIISGNKSAFSGQRRFSFWERFNSLHRPGVITSTMEKSTMTMTMNQQAMSLVKLLYKNLIESKSFWEALNIATRSIFTAADSGNHEVVEMIVEAFPNAIYSGQPIFHVAVLSRSESVFNLIQQMSDHKYVHLDIEDDDGNNLLHAAGKLAPSHKLNEISGAALQMQREMQWYKQVEKTMNPSSRKRANKQGKSPNMVFTEEHKKLKEEGEKWMKDTSESCTIAAALIVTIMFAAAITVPGGNESDTGFPVFAREKVFLVFAISDAISLFASTTSLLMFLSILTSRYAEEDFLSNLPKRLIIGLGTLFLSITFMMVAFSATLYLVFGRKNAWVLIPVAALACLPVTSFVFLQFPLLADLISSTFGPGIFRKQSNRPFY